MPADTLVMRTRRRAARHRATQESIGRVRSEASDWKNPIGGKRIPNLSHVRAELPFNVQMPARLGVPVDMYVSRYREESDPDGDYEIIIMGKGLTADDLLAIATAFQA